MYKTKEMTAKNRVLRLFKLLILSLLLAPLWVLAQNNSNLLPPNVSNFNIGTVGNGHSSNDLANVNVTTQYTYKKTENSLLSNTTGPQCYAVGDNANWYNHQTNWTGIEQGFFSMGDHTSGTGNYMIVNGATASGRKVWEYTVPVSPGVIYDFEAWTTCLFIRIAGMPSLSTCPRLSLKINDRYDGIEGAQPFTVPWVNGGQWTLWSLSWTAGNNVTSAKITIIDECVDSDGNDFGLDDLVFKMRDGYVVTANAITEDYCAVSSSPFEINLNGHCTIAWPDGGENAPPMQVKISNGNGQWVNSITTNHGSAYVQNNRIYYTPNAGYYDQDSFQYQISRFGLVSQNTITINVMGVPSNCTPQGLPADGTLCMDDVPSFNPSANWANNGSSIFSSYWEFKKNGVSGWQSSNNFLSYVQNSGGTGLYSIRFYAENGCGSATSEAQFNVIDEPTIGPIGNIIPTSVCAPTTLSLNAPSVEDNGAEIIAEGWQMQIGGQWVNIPNPIEYGHNGNSIRYYAENGCGSSYSNPPVSLVVNAAPIVGPINPPLGICAGEAFDLSLVTPNPVWRHNDPSTCWGGWEIQINGEWEPLVNNDIPFEYNGCLIRYKAVNGCDTTYSTNNVPVTVYSTEPVDEGNITACDPIYHHGVQCNETATYVWNDSITPNGCQIQVSWHFTLDTVNMMPPIVVDACDSYYWPRTHDYYYNTGMYYDTVPGVGNVCDSIITLDLTINHAPTLQGGIQINDICVGELVSAIEPGYDYNHIHGGHRQWEYAASPDGAFQSFAPETHHFGYGSYYLRFAVYNDCDSVFSNTVLLHVNDQPVITGLLEPFQVCAGDPLDLPELDVDWRNAAQDGFSDWQMADSQYGSYHHFDPGLPMQMEYNNHWVRFRAGNECDTVYLGPVKVTVIGVQDITMEHGPECDSLLFAGVYYFESVTIDEEVEEPCPYTIHHEIIVNHSDYKEIERTTCHEFFDWHGHHFEHSDETQYAEFDTINRYHCDSIVVLKLDFGDYEKINLEDGIGCDSYVWDMKPEHVYYESQRDSILIPPSSPEDCPTWYCLNIIVGNSCEVEGEPWTKCHGFEWHGVPCYADTLVCDSLLTKVTQCDSLVYHQLTIIQPFDTLVELASCKPIYWHGHHFVMDTIVTDTLQSFVTGCDSIVTIHFRKNDDNTPYDEYVEACGSFEWYGNTCDFPRPEPYIFYHTFENDDCDSTVCMHVTLKHIARNATFDYRCDTATYYGVFYELAEGESFHSYRIVYDTLVSPNGCDSILVLNLILRDSNSIGQICGNSYVYVASSLTSGIYRYEIDTASIEGSISWSLSNPQWRVLDQDAVSCRVLVLSPGSAELVAHFRADCGEMDRIFNINATFYDVNEHDVIAAKVYPNPTQGTVTIEAEGIESIRLTNMVGQVLDWREYDRSDTVVLSLSGYAPSVYLLEIETVNGMVKKRVAVSR